MKRSPKISTNPTQKTLDETLRYLYATLVYLEVPILAIRFQFDGETWEADTPEEAVALRHKLEYSVRFGPDPLKEMDKQERFWTPDRVMDVIGAVGKYQHRFLMFVWEQKRISSTDLIEKLGLKSEVALAGVISGLSKQLRALNIEPNQVFAIEVKWDGKKKNRTFILNDFFAGAAVEQNWPEAWANQVLHDDPDEAG